MLKARKKICKSCGLSKLIWKDGKCQDCCKPDFKTLKSNGSGLKSFTKLKNKRKGKSKETQDFYKEQIELYSVNPTSFESGQNIGLVTSVNIAHIFPKETYKSVAREPLNIILLSWDEHTRFDELLNRHAFTKLEEEFKCWYKVCMRISSLLPMITEEGNLKTELKKYLDR